MTSDVSVKTGVLPVGVVVGLGGESCAFELRSEKSVGIEGEKILDVHILCMFECTLRKSYVGNAEILHLGGCLRQGGCHTNGGK